MVFYRGIYIYWYQMMEILKSYFNREEVKKLQDLPNYAETKQKIEQMQADKMLDSLASRIWENIKTAKTLEEKWEIFTSSLESHDKTPKTWTGESPEWWINFSKLSKEKIQKMADDWTKGAQEFLDSQVAKWLDTLVSWFKKTTQESWLGKIIPKKLIEWIAQTGREKAEGKLEGIGWEIKWWILWFIVGFFPGGNLLMKGYEEYFWEEVWEWDSKWNEEENPQEAPKGWADTPEFVAEWNEIQKQNKDRYAFSGKLCLKEVSWERFETNNNSDLIITQLRWTPFWKIQDAYIVYLKNVDNWEWKNNNHFNKLLSDLWLNMNTSISQKTVLATIESIGWVISTEFIGEFLNKNKLDTFGKDTEFQNTFGKDFAVQIWNKDVRELSLTELQICLAYALPEYMKWLYNSPTKKVWSLAVSLFTENTLLEQVNNTPLLSSRVGEVILSEASSPVMIQEDYSFKNAIKFDELSESEQQQIEVLIGFKDIFLKKLWESKFTLWMPDFEEKLNKGLDYRNLIQIYVFLNGNTELNNLSDFQSSILCLWTMNTMEDKGAYEWRLLDTLSDDDTFTDIQKMFIAKHGTKISHSFFEKSLQLVWQWRDAAKEIVKIKISEATWIPEEEISDRLLDTTEIFLVWWLILWGFAVYKLPLPLHFKVILWWTLHAWGFSAMASVLYDMWTFDKIFYKMWDTKIRKQLDIILEQKFKMNLEEIINSKEKPDFYS